MQSLENGIFAFFLGEIVEARGTLLARGQWAGPLVFEEVFFLAEAVKASS